MGATRTTRAALTLCAGLLALGGCSATEPLPRPTIGSPTPTPAEASAGPDRAFELAERWELTGAPLPEDWPDAPLPEGSEVVTAYAIGSLPRRTWTATFTTNGGTALDMAEPIVAELRDREYVPIAEYVGAAETNTGLYSFAAPTFNIYIVLGEDDGQPNLVITVRGSTGPEGAGDAPVRPPASAQAPTAGPTVTPAPSGSGTPSDTASGSADPESP
jgi:hypothetical protein